jgi:hypothetical protein
MLSCKPNKYGGYAEFCIYIDKIQRTMQVHQQVALAFIGPAEGRQVRHLDGNRLNNKLENLAYGTPRENQNDRRDSKYKGAKLATHQQIEEAKDLVEKGFSLKQIATLLGLSENHIRPHLELLPTEINRDKVWRCVKTGAAVTKIAKAFNVTHQAITTLLRINYEPLRLLRKNYPLNKSVTVQQLRNIIDK